MQKHHDPVHPQVRRIELDGCVMSTLAITHDYLQHCLGLPTYYGRNLDALHDVLSTVGKPLSITLLHPDCLESHLGDYAGRLLEVFADAASENPCLDFHIG